MFRLWRFCWIIGLTAACQERPIVLSASELNRQEQRRLALAGFEPIETLAARGLDVQRVDFLYELFGSPSVELVRAPAGTTTLRLHYWGHSDSIAVEAEIWDQLSAMVAAGALAAPAARDLRRSERRVTRCHAWHTTEISFGGGVARAAPTPCLGDLHERGLAYVDAVARTAIMSLPRCAPFREQPTDQALLACAGTFGPPTQEYRSLRERLG